MESVENKIIKYQWIKGDKFGNIVELESSDNDFLYFKDGSRIFKNVVSEFLEEIIDGQLPLPGADKAAKAISGEVTTTVDSSPTITSNLTSNSSVDSVLPEPTIMGKMITKMSKKNVVNVPIQINLNIPTQGLYAMLSEGMEAEDLNEEIMQVALQQIEINKLQEYIKTNITDFLTEYYS